MEQRPEGWSGQTVNQNTDRDIVCCVAGGTDTDKTFIESSAVSSAEIQVK
jgi:hypothetical protein